MVEKITVYMGEEELTSEDVKKYICVSPLVSEIVNRVYYRNKQTKPRKNERNK